MAPISNRQAAPSGGDGVPALVQTPSALRGQGTPPVRTFFEAYVDALIEHLYDERARHTSEVR